MTAIHRRRAVAGLLVLALVCLTGSPVPAQDEEPNEAVIQMVAELVADADRDMRALGLQQVREEVRGEAATKKFAELLPNLPPDGQADLLEALGDRQDAAARPAILETLKSESEAVRAAALGALGSLGSTAEVPLLAAKAATGSDLEKSAARQSLVRMRGDEASAAILELLGQGEPPVRVVLLDALAARNAKEALPAVLQSAADPDPSVRVAALGALRFLADESQAAAVVKALKAAQGEVECKKAELALLVLCSRGREACAGAVIEGLADAAPPARIALLRALARAGGTEAMAAIVARLEDEDAAVCDEAVRMLAGLGDPAVATHLSKLAASDNPKHQVLAIRGMVRLANPLGDRPANTELLDEAFQASKRLQEKRIVVGTLGGIASAPSLALVVTMLDDAELAEDAALAAVRIVETMEDGDATLTKSAMEKVLTVAKDEKVRGRAQKLIQ
ncbi:MAG: HEAT repeat domain-containing protein [Planctomycetes bacterium]|nr:HEAT repeat domain-containing protein [Planctomycetota bacterium]